MAITSAIKTSGNSICQKIETLAVTFGVQPAIWLLHQPNCGNSICHCGNNISHIHVTFHLSQLLPHKCGFHYPLEHTVTTTSATMALITDHQTTRQ